MSPTTALYTAAQVRVLDAFAIDRLGVPGFELMRRAAQAALDDLRRRWPAARRLTIVCGPGNNGGDGFLLGTLALSAGCEVECVALTETSRGDAALARHALLEAGGRIAVANPQMTLPSADVYVDALFGSGFDRAAKGVAARLIEALNGVVAPVLALDAPSGLDADTGACLGACVRAAATVCFVGWKRGLFTHQAADACGERVLATLDLPGALYAEFPPDAELLVAESLPPRMRDSHKGDYGHVLAIGGERGFGGAVRLAGEAALRCGAGLVSVATRAEHVAALLSARPELMAQAIDDAGALAPLIERAGVLLVGPGLGQNTWGRALCEAALDAAQPLLLDADGLNLLAQSPRDFRGRVAVLTPHPGEAARLLGCDIAAVQRDRFAAVRALAQRYAAIVVLKGAGSLVATSDGHVAVCPWGNPGMASGGMGDVLGGVIAALLAQGLDAFHAACLGVGLHARAGDRAACEGERGLLASDLFTHLRALVNADG
jgi:NAD(P)H-hydrate epimerase